MADDDELDRLEQIAQERLKILDTALIRLNGELPLPRDEYGKYELYRNSEGHGVSLQCRGNDKGSFDVNLAGNICYLNTHRKLFNEVCGRGINKTPTQVYNEYISLRARINS